MWRTVLPVRLVQTSPSPSPSPSPRAHRRQARACRLVGGVDLAIHQNTVLFGKTPTVTPRRRQRRASGLADEPRAWSARGGGSPLRTVPFLVGASQWRTQPPGIAEDGGGPLARSHAQPRARAARARGTGRSSGHGRPHQRRHRARTNPRPLRCRGGRAHAVTWLRGSACRGDCSHGCDPVILMLHEIKLGIPSPSTADLIHNLRVPI